MEELVKERPCPFCDKTSYLKTESMTINGITFMALYYDCGTLGHDYDDEATATINLWEYKTKAKENEDRNNNQNNNEE